MAKQIIKVTIARLETTEVLVEIDGDWTQQTISNTIAQEMMKKAQHEIEWYAGDTIRCVEIGPIAEKELEQRQEGNEPIYNLEKKEWK
jgi:hypothetical protein